MPRRSYSDLGFSVRRPRLVLFDDDWTAVEWHAQQHGMSVVQLVQHYLSTVALDARCRPECPGSYESIALGKWSAEAQR